MIEKTMSLAQRTTTEEEEPPKATVSISQIIAKEH